MMPPGIQDPSGIVIANLEPIAPAKLLGICVGDKLSKGNKKCKRTNRNHKQQYNKWTLIKTFTINKIMANFSLN